MAETKEIKIDVNKFKEEVGLVKNKWLEDLKNKVPNTPDPGLELLKVYQEAASRLGVAAEDIQYIKKSQFQAVLSTTTIPYVKNEDLNPDSANYTGGDGAGENHDIDPDKDGKILFDDGPLIHIIKINVIAAKSKQFTDAAKTVTGVAEGKSWYDQKGVWKTTDLETGEEVFAYTVRYLEGKLPDSDLPDWQINWPTKKRTVEVGEGGVTKVVSKDAPGEFTGGWVHKRSDPRSLALTPILKFANIDEDAFNYDEMLTVNNLKAQLSNMGDGITNEDKFALMAADQGDFRTTGEKHFATNQNCDASKVTISADWLSTLKEKPRIAPGSKETDRYIQFRNGGLNSRMTDFGDGFGFHLNQVAEILEAYAKVMKKSRRKFSIDLAKEAKNLRKIPSQFLEILKLNEAPEWQATLDPGVNNLYRIIIDKDFKVVDIAVIPDALFPGQSGPPSPEYELRFGLDQLRTEGPFSSPRTLGYFLYAETILKKIIDASKVELYPWVDFVTEFTYPVPDIGPEPGGPITDLLEDAVLFGAGDLLDDTFVIDGTDKISPKLVKNIENEAQNLYHLIGDEIFGGQILSDRMEDIYTFEDFFLQILNKISIGELIGIAFKCLAKFTDLPGYLDAGCEWAIEKLGLAKAERELLPLLRKKDPKIAAFFEKKLAQLRAGAISGVSNALVDNTVVEHIEQADQIVFLKEKSSKDVKNALDKGFKDIMGDMKTSDMGVAICAAVLLLFPAVFQFFKEDIDEEKIWLAAKKRFDVFIMVDFPITDFLSHIAMMVIQIMLNVLKDVLLALVEKILAQVNAHCSETAEADLLNSDPDSSPYDMANINDIIRENASPEEFDKAINDLFIELETTINVTKVINFTDFFDDLSKLLTISQLCALLSGEMPSDVYLLIRTLIQQKYTDLLPFLDDGSVIEKIFAAIATIIDPAACRKLIDENEKRKELIASCCFEDPTAAKEKILSEKIGPERAKEQIEDEKQKNKELIKSLIPFVADPDYLNNMIPPLFCGPGTPNGIIKMQQPSIAYMFDNILAATFQTVEDTFNSDIKGFKKMIMGKDIPGVAPFDPDELHETFGDSVSTWLDMLISMILPFADGPEKVAKKEHYKNSLGGATSPEDTLFIAKELRKELSSENLLINFFKGEIEGFEINFNDSDRRITYFENTREESIKLPLYHQDTLNKKIVLGASEYRIDLSYKKDGKRAVKASKVGTITDWAGKPMSGREKLKEVIRTGPLTNLFAFSGGAESQKLFAKTVLQSPELDDMYEAILKGVYKRFIEASTESGFFKRNIFKFLKLESGPPPLKPAFPSADGLTCDVVTDEELKNPDFMSATVFIDKVKKRREELECKVKDPEAQAIREAVVEMFARLQAINVFIKLIFAISLFDFKNVYESDIVKALIQTELKEDLLKIGGVGQIGRASLTQQRLSREIQKIGIGLIEVKEQDAKEKAEQSAVDPETIDYSLKDPITGEPVIIDTGSEALLFLAKNEISDIKALFQEKMKHLIPHSSIFDRATPTELFSDLGKAKVNKYFDRITHSEFVDMPYGVDSTGVKVGTYVGADVYLPIEMKELDAPDDFPGHTKYPRYLSIREQTGLKGGLFYERYIRIVPKKLSKSVEDQLNSLIKKAPVIGTRLLWLLSLQDKMIGIGSDEQWSVKGKMNLQRAREYYVTDHGLPFVHGFNYEELLASSKKIGVIGAAVNLSLWNLFISLPYTEFFEQITFGVRLCAVASPASDVDFSFIQTEFEKWASDSPDIEIYSKLRESMLEEKVLIMNQNGEENFLVLPLMETDTKPFPEDTTIGGLLISETSTLRAAISIFETAATGGTLKTAKDLKEKLQTATAEISGVDIPGEKLIDEIFNMDRFMAAMTAHHIIAFDNAYPEMIDLFNNTKAQLGALISIVTNLGKFNEPLMDEFDPDVGVDPWWESFDIKWEDIPIFLLQTLASMVDPTWKTDWLWQGGPGPLTPIGIAAKLLGDDPTGASEDREKDITQQCEDVLKARADAAKGVLEKATAALDAASKGDTDTTFWDKLDLEEKKVLLKFHMTDILVKNTQKSYSWSIEHGLLSEGGGNDGKPTLYFRGGFLFDDDSGISSDFKFPGKEDAHFGTGGWPEKFPYLTYEEALLDEHLAEEQYHSFHTKWFKSQTTGRVQITNFVNKYLAGYYGILVKRPEGVGANKDWPEMDKGLLQLRNALSRFICGLKLNTYWDSNANTNSPTNGGLGRRSYIPIDFVWFPNLTPNSAGWNSTLMSLSVNTPSKFEWWKYQNFIAHHEARGVTPSLGELPSKGWVTSAASAAGATADASDFETHWNKDFMDMGWNYVWPGFIADVTQAGGHNHLLETGYVCYYKNGDDFSRHLNRPHEYHMDWFYEYSVVKEGGVLKDKRTNVIDIPKPKASPEDPDEFWEGSHAIGEFYVWHPRAGHNDLGAWINLPHLSANYLSAFYFEDNTLGVSRNEWKYATRGPGHPGAGVHKNTWGQDSIEHKDYLKKETF